MGYLCSRMCVNRGGEGGGMEVGEKSCYEHKNVKSNVRNVNKGCRSAGDGCDECMLVRGEGVCGGECVNMGEGVQKHMRMRWM